MTMITNATEEVRRVLDAVQAEGRTALTAPEGKRVCEAYGITVPKEGVATSAADAAKIAAGIGFPVGQEVSRNPPQDRGGRLAGRVKSAEKPRRDTHVIANAKKYNARVRLASR